MKKKKVKPGRPKALIDWHKVDQYLQAQCNGTGIAGLLGIDCETLYNRCKEDNKMGFSEYSALKKAEGLELLRTIQFQNAMGGNPVMQIWLGKQYLGQKDKASLEGGDRPLSLNINVTSKENLEKLKNFLNGGQPK